MEGTVPTRAKAGVTVLLVAALLALTGAALGAGGVRLLTLGGSPYYLIVGLALFIAGVQVWRGRAAALWLYLAVLGGTWLWALWETGGNGWALVPRVGFLTGLALVFLLPPVVRHLGWADRARGAGIALAGVLGLAVLTVGGIIVAAPGWPAGASAAGAPAPAAPTEWTAWGADPGGTRFTPAAQITPANVAGLSVAWTYATGAKPRDGGAPALAFEVTPLKIGNTLYGCTPHNVLFALDPASGKERWRYDPQTDDKGLAFANCRGVAYADLSARGLAPAVAAGLR